MKEGERDDGGSRQKNRRTERIKRRCEADKADSD